MRSRFPLLIISSIIFLLIDVYNYKGVSQLSSVSGWTWLSSFYIVTAFLGFLGLALAITRWHISPLQRGVLLNWLIGFAFVMAITRLVFALSLVVQDAWRILEGVLVATGLDLFQADGTFPPRRVILTVIGALLASIPFIGMLIGITIGKYRYKVEKVEFKFSNLPKAFDGFRLVQISDIHSGSWDSTACVQRGIDMIDNLHPDMIVFTGDMVNADKNEIDPFIPQFAKLQAPHGKYAILGNHDYYGQPRDASLRPAYYEDYFSKFKAMGWDLILNQSRTIEKDGEMLQLVGVENWGEGKYFPKRGDLDQALQSVDDNDFAILLSHDPTHWKEKVLPHPRPIPLTLSGHTHGMQFGINLPFLKWSPVQYRYKNWIGAYHQDKQYLYVNRGFGYLAFPGRVGMWPEITEITLRRG